MTSNYHFFPIGEIPNSMCQLTSLKILCLGKNRFTGHIPIDICQLKSLEGLFLHENQLDGKVAVVIE